MHDKKKLCIIGCGLSHKKAPYGDDSYEIWSLNEFEPPRYDIMFELHPMEVQNERELEFLMNCEKPVYVLSETPLVPNGIEFPLDEILKQSWAIEYFTCTMAYQIAYAIHLGFEEIQLWGLNMDYGSPREKTVESACIQYWVGIAKGKGIKVKWDENPANWRWKYGYEYFQEKSNIENWICRLAVSSIYRLGPTASMGGDGLPIRKEHNARKLLDYAGHKKDCKMDDFHECTCGLDDILRSL